MDKRDIAYLASTGNGLRKSDIRFLKACDEATQDNPSVDTADVDIMTAPGSAEAETYPGETAADSDSGIDSQSDSDGGVDAPPMDLDDDAVTSVFGPDKEAQKTIEELNQMVDTGRGASRKRAEDTCQKNPELKANPEPKPDVPDGVDKTSKGSARKSNDNMQQREELLSDPAPKPDVPDGVDKTSAEDLHTEGDSDLQVRDTENPEPHADMPTGAPRVSTQKKATPDAESKLPKNAPIGQPAAKPGQDLEDLPNPAYPNSKITLAAAQVIMAEHLRVKGESQGPFEGIGGDPDFQQVTTPEASSKADLKTEFPESDEVNPSLQPDNSQTYGSKKGFKTTPAVEPTYPENAPKGQPVTPDGTQVQKMPPEYSKTASGKTITIRIEE